MSVIRCTQWEVTLAFPECFSIQFYFMFFGSILKQTKKYVHRKTLDKRIYTWHFVPFRKRICNFRSGTRSKWYFYGT